VTKCLASAILSVFTVEDRFHGKALRWCRVAVSPRVVSADGRGCRLACRGQGAGRHCGRDGLIEFFDEAAAGRRARRSATVRVGCWPMWRLCWRTDSAHRRPFMKTGGPERDDDLETQLLRTNLVLTRRFPSWHTLSLGCRCGGVEGDVVAEALELAEGVSLEALGVAAGEVVRSWIVV
jgi:hypothetical protein